MVRHVSQCLAFVLAAQGHTGGGGGGGGKFAGASIEMTLLRGVSGRGLQVSHPPGQVITLNSPPGLLLLMVYGSVCCSIQRHSVALLH